VKPRVVLYNPRAVFYTMPLALVAIASNLDRAKVEVVIIDGRLEADPAGAVVAAARGAVCVGITVLTGAPIHDALAVSRAVKASQPDCPIVWGGWHPSLFANECLADPAVDIVVSGQGEGAFRGIVDRLIDDGLVERVRSVNDRRVIEVTLTAEGVAYRCKFHGRCRVPAADITPHERRLLLLDETPETAAAPEVPEVGGG